jgi:hypothetical protein
MTTFQEAMREFCSPPGAAPATLSPSHSLSDSLLRDHAANFGRLLDAAYVSGDRDLALIFQRAMFDVVKLRQARRFGVDTQNRGSAA